MTTPRRSTILFLVSVVTIFRGSRAIENTSTPPKTFAEWKVKFIEKYADSLDVALEKLAGRSQKPDETPEKYCRDIINMCKKVNTTMTTKEIIHHLKRGLLDKYRQPMVYMRPQTEKEFQDRLKELVTNTNTPQSNAVKENHLTEALVTIANQNALLIEQLNKKPEPTLVATTKQVK